MSSQTAACMGEHSAVLFVNSWVWFFSWIYLFITPDLSFFSQGEPGFPGYGGLPGVIGYPGNEGQQGPPGEKVTTRAEWFLNDSPKKVISSSIVAVVFPHQGDYGVSGGTGLKGSRVALMLINPNMSVLINSESSVHIPCFLRDFQEDLVCQELQDCQWVLCPLNLLRSLPDLDKF